MSFGENVRSLVDGASDSAVSKAQSWERVFLGDVATILNGYPWKSEHFTNSEGVALIRIRDVTTGHTETHYNGPIVDGFWVDPGDLLVGMDGDFNLRRWQSGRGLLNQRVCKLEANSEVYLSEFLEYVLPAYLQLINDNTSSVTVKHLSSRTLAEVPLPLPPLDEQRRIVAKLDAFTACVARARAELNQVPALARRLRAASLSVVFSEQDNELIKLGELLVDVQAGKNLKCDERSPAHHERGIVKVSAVSSETFRASESKTLPTSYVPPVRDLIGKGDLLIARASGSLSLVGRVVLVAEEPMNLYLSDKVLRLVVQGDLTHWVYWFLRSPSGRRQIEDAASGISMHNITQSSLRSILIPLPSEGRRRRAIEYLEATFASADRLETEAARARALLDRLEAAILAKAFRGGLVPHDPNDEPASVLLERIRAQRAAAPAFKRGRRT